MKFNQLLIGLLIVTFMSCSQENNKNAREISKIPEQELPSQKETNENPNKTISKEDSTFVESFIKNLKGIERFVVKDNFELLAGLLKFKGESEYYQKVNIILEKNMNGNAPKFTFIIIDAKNGYIKYNQALTEATYTMTYWNLKDGAKLIATELWSCGPICESEISFQKYNNEQYENIQNEDVIPEIKRLRKIILPNYDPNGEPEEFKFKLPQGGKNIQFLLNDRSIELEWQNGVFKMIEEYHYL